ncbi:8535_t:CDS:1, partial [Funneliformis geosporum]
MRVENIEQICNISPPDQQIKPKPPVHSMDLDKSDSNKNLQPIPSS